MFCIKVLFNKEQMVGKFCIRKHLFYIRALEPFCEGKDLRGLPAAGHILLTEGWVKNPSRPWAWVVWGASCRWWFACLAVTVVLCALAVYVYRIEEKHTTENAVIVPCVFRVLRAFLFVFKTLQSSVSVWRQGGGQLGPPVHTAHSAASLGPSCCTHHSHFSLQASGSLSFIVYTWRNMAFQWDLYFPP